MVSRLSWCVVQIPAPRSIENKPFGFHDYQRNNNRIIGIETRYFLKSWWKYIEYLKTKVWLPNIQPMFLECMVIFAILKVNNICCFGENYRTRIDWTMAKRSREVGCLFPIVPHSDSYSWFQHLDIRESVVEAVRQGQQLISLWQSIQSQVDAFRFQYTMDGLQFELQELETQRHKVHKAFKHLDSSTQALSSLL